MTTTYKYGTDLLKELEIQLEKAWMEMRYNLGMMVDCRNDYNLQIRKEYLKRRHKLQKKLDKNEINKDTFIDKLTKLDIKLNKNIQDFVTVYNNRFANKFVIKLEGLQRIIKKEKDSTPGIHRKISSVSNTTSKRQSFSSDDGVLENLHTTPGNNVSDTNSNIKSKSSTPTTSITQTPPRSESTSSIGTIRDEEEKEVILDDNYETPKEPEDSRKIVKQNVSKSYPTVLRQMKETYPEALYKYISELYTSEVEYAENIKRGLQVLEELKKNRKSDPRFKELYDIYTIRLIRSEQMQTGFLKYLDAFINRGYDNFVVERENLKTLLKQFLHEVTPITMKLDTIFSKEEARKLNIEWNEIHIKKDFPSDKLTGASLNLFQQRLMKYRILLNEKVKQYKKSKYQEVTKNIDGFNQKINDMQEIANEYHEINMDENNISEIYNIRESINKYISIRWKDKNLHAEDVRSKQAREIIKILEDKIILEECKRLQKNPFGRGIGNNKQEISGIAIELKKIDDIATNVENTQEKSRLLPIIRKMRGEFCRVGGVFFHHEYKRLDKILGDYKRSKSLKTNFFKSKGDIACEIFANNMIKRLKEFKKCYDKLDLNGAEEFLEKIKNIRDNDVKTPGLTKIAEEVCDLCDKAFEGLERVVKEKNKNIEKVNDSNTSENYDNNNLKL